MTRTTRLARLLPARLVALLALAGAALPVASWGAEPQVLVARGQEPSWRLDVGADGLVLQAPPLGIHFRAAEVERTRAGGRSRLLATDRGRRLVVTVSERPCADTMTGMPFPLRVTLELDGRRLAGCGGETLSLIEGGWRVIRLADQPVPAGAVLTMTFGRDGRVAGRSACNRFTGAYTLGAEGLAFGALATTRMACPPPVMAIEARFLALARSVTRVTTGQGRQLRLMAGDRQALVLERVR